MVVRTSNRKQVWRSSAVEGTMTTSSNTEPCLVFLHPLVFSELKLFSFFFFPKCAHPIAVQLRLLATATVSFLPSQMRQIVVHVPAGTPKKKRETDLCVSAYSAAVVSTELTGGGRSHIRSTIEDVVANSQSSQSNFFPLCVCTCSCITVYFSLLFSSFNSR